MTIVFIFVNYILCINLLAGFLARDCYEGIRTWDLWVQCSDRKLQKGNSWRYPGISGPTCCLTSCSPVVRVLVYQPSGPGLIPGMSRSESAIIRGKTQMMLLPPIKFLWTACFHCEFASLMLLHNVVSFLWIIVEPWYQLSLSEYFFISHISNNIWDRAGVELEK